MEKPDLRKIIEQVKKGDETAFRSFFKWYYPHCIRQLIKVTQSKEDAHDALMTAFYKFWEKFVKGNEPLPKNNVKGYLFIMAKNVWLNGKKKTVQKKTNHWDSEQMEYFLEQHYKMADSNILIKEEEKKHLEETDKKKLLAIAEALQELGEKCRKLLTETIIYGTKLKDLTKDLNYSSYDSIKTMKNKCKNKLIKLATSRYEKK